MTVMSLLGRGSLVMEFDSSVASSFTRLDVVIPPNQGLTAVGIPSTVLSGCVLAECEVTDATMLDLESFIVDHGPFAHRFA
jgi:hypothetical protein